MSSTAKASGRPFLGTLERAVLDVLWAGDAPLSGREVHTVLAVRRPLAYVTVTTVLGRLTEKGLVRQSREARAFRYTPLRSCGSIVADHMLQALDECDPGSRRAALVRFVDTISAEDAATILRLLGPSERSAA
ncbi:BlaI/MecI/CopY family transcriptional regulator [Skermania piniformis]|uniref:BlaI/MecI/CopY family transcriptional regulator n=1 Tax=Skermania pinensis TaxID=39122 RepID=A0ABX8S5G3_9ACTN|nr:BlaI/MecI/CopY family transcriptional regulator [Skermania piniformis]QXQ12387.1 BlaI/MecI/CopY family transcriptional regulator [Skermania piniformis]